MKLFISIAIMFQGYFVLLGQAPVDPILKELQKSGKPWDGLSNLVRLDHGSMPSVLYSSYSITQVGSNNIWDSNLVSFEPVLDSKLDSLPLLAIDPRIKNIHRIFTKEDKSLVAIATHVTDTVTRFIDSLILVKFDSNLQISQIQTVPNPLNQVTVANCPAVLDRKENLLHCGLATDVWPYNILNDLYSVVVKHDRNGNLITRQRIGLSAGRIAAVVSFTDTTYAFLIAGQVAVTDTLFLPKYLFSTGDVTNEACENVKGAIVEENGGVITAMACDKVFLNNNGSTSKFRYDKLCRVSAPDISNTIADISVPFDSTWTAFFFRETLTEDSERFYFGNNYIRSFQPYANQFTVHAVNKTSGVSYSRFYSTSNRNLRAHQYLALGSGKLMIALEEGSYNAQNQYDQNFYYIVLESDGTVSTTESSPGIADIVQEVAIYPNPVSNYLYLPAKLSQNGLIRIHNTNGVLMSTSLNDKEGIDVSKLPQGIYILSIEGENGQVRHYSRFVKI
jgi:hypothetical protein